MTETEGNGTVRYNVKDLLADINQKLDRFLEKLEAKASAADLEKVEARVGILEEGARLSVALANTRETSRDKGLSRWQSYIVILSSLASTAAIAATAFAYFH